MSNDKTYTEVLLEVHDKLDEMERRTITRLDGVQNGVNGNTVALARVETKMDSMCKSIDKNADDIDKCGKDVTKLERDNKLLGGINGLFTGIVAAVAIYFGSQK